MHDMKVEVLPDVAAASRRAAEIIARLARDRVGETGRFVMAVSGGTEPWQAFRHLATLDVPWKDVHRAQVDERGVSSQPTSGWCLGKAARAGG